VQSDLEACLHSPIAAIVDMRTQNFSLIRTSGIDVEVRHTRETDIGLFDFRFDGTWLRDLQRSQFSGSPLQELLNTPGQPIDLRGRASLTWSRGDVDVTAHVTYSDNYRDDVSRPQRAVDSWTTVDLQATYRLPRSTSRFLDAAVISVNAQNAFDTAPPFLNNPLGVAYDPYNADPIGRVVSAQVRIPLKMTGHSVRT
jgi:iron complex outermembrane recepter protein